MNKEVEINELKQKYFQFELLFQKKIESLESEVKSYRLKEIKINKSIQTDQDESSSLKRIENLLRQYLKSEFINDINPELIIEKNLIHIFSKTKNLVLNEKNNKLNSNSQTRYEKAIPKHESSSKKDNKQRGMIKFFNDIQNKNKNENENENKDRFSKSIYSQKSKTYKCLNNQNTYAISVSSIQQRLKELNRIKDLLGRENFLVETFNLYSSRSNPAQNNITDLQK